MDFESWWMKQTTDFDPSEIGLMQLARVTWNAAQDFEREACAKVCEARAADHASMIRSDEADECAEAIRMRSNG